MLFSVIVPVKQDPEGLQLTLSSLPPDPLLQIIVIDGGDDRDTLKIIRSHSANLHYWESGQDCGIADAMNRGLSAATGSWLAILNAGDVWLPTTLSDVRSAIIQRPGADIYHGTIEFIGESGNTHQVAPDATRLAERMFVFHPTLFISSSCYQAVGYYDLTYDYAMDSNWCHRALASNFRFQDVGKPLARMALGGRSDLHYYRALKEYRRSVIECGLSGKIAATWHYLRILAGKWLLSHNWINSQALRRAQRT